MIKYKRGTIYFKPALLILILDVLLLFNQNIAPKCSEYEKFSYICSVIH